MDKEDIFRAADAYADKSGLNGVEREKAVAHFVSGVEWVRDYLIRVINQSATE